MPVAGEILDRVLGATHPVWHQGLTAHAFGQLHTARMRTGWARRHQRHVALIDGAGLLASAVRYQFDAVLDGRPLQVCGIGSVFTQPEHRGHGHATALVERLLDDAARDGADLALMFGDADATYATRHGFSMVPTVDVTMTVVESTRYGAPMTLIRGGEERDLAAIVAMGRVRAASCRFHLDRDLDLVQHGITRRRLVAGLGPAGARELQFFIAEEGITAAAYVVLSVAGDTWTLEECGDRDQTGARVGAILQALIARAPVERRPTIRGWLPPHFAPPQVTLSAASSSRTLLLKQLRGGSFGVPLGLDDVLYWCSDVF
ncbi:MAG: GNAT family N-acetyltransferase [Vicinamibacteraceae bacterium]